MAKPIKCPVCKMPTGFYKEAAVEPVGDIIMTPYLLYQRSYSKKDKGYISTRCYSCYDKAERKNLC